MDKREAAQWFYTERRIFSVPAPHMKKGPVIPDWNQLRISAPEDFQKYFNGERQNLCILTGPDNLTDVDIDSIEAWWAWKEYWLPTGMKWGHGKLTPTHFLYLVDEPPASIRYLDPAVDDPKAACLIELRCQDKGGKCLNTMAPPSVHPDDEDVEFVGGAGFPGKAIRDDLQKRARLTAVASMLGRHARDGSCHQIFLALAGALRRAEWTLADAQQFVRAIFRAKWREAADLAAADKEVDSTYQHFDDGGETTGLLTLAGLLNEKVYRRGKHLLGLDSQEAWMHNQPPPQRKPVEWPQAYPIEELRNRVIAKPQVLIDKFVSTPSISLLVAPGKIGKTVFAVQAAMSVANGLGLFDTYPTSKAAGLIVEFDDQQGESSLQDFLLKCRASRPDQLLDIVTRPKEAPTISDPGFRPWLTEQILRRPAQFVVLDSLTALRGFGADDKNRNVVKLDASEIMMLGEIAIETKSAILLLHHDSKTAASLDLFSRAAGTFAMQACSDTQIVLGRFPNLPVNDPARLVSVRGRHLEGLQAVLLFREATLDYDYILDGAIATRYPELQTLLRGFRGKSFDAKEAKEQTGWGHSKTYETLGALTYAGILTRTSGSWTWNPSWSRTLDQI
jgi:AAA domain/Bifunctional DNA primase/polymerase, N-terminal